jgi:F-type H+/Na+-transporting ATPase subunit alpha
VEVGDELLAHTVDGLGRPIFGKPVSRNKLENRLVDVEPLGVVRRRKISKPMHTGVSLVDLLIPLGEGQRELVLGDRKTGKSNLLLQAAVTQAKRGTVCIYAAIAKKKQEIKKIEVYFQENQVWNNLILVSTSPLDSPGEITWCPYTAMAMAEYFRDKGKNVLVILDDLSAHAIFYRELSLTSRKFPGRDSYPGDMFYVHSKLLERAGNFSINDKDVAITCLPVAETAQSDITGYIQTNLMSMTDGHIFFDADLFSRGRRPAINPFASVTRVGHQTQTPLSREAGRILTDLLSSYEKTQQFLRFGAELGESSRQVLTMGERVLSFFNQPVSKAVEYNLQLVLLALLISGMWDGGNLEKILDNYAENNDTLQLIEQMVSGSENMNKLIEQTRRNVTAIQKLIS